MGQYNCSITTEEEELFKYDEFSEASIEQRVHVQTVIDDPKPTVQAKPPSPKHEPKPPSPKPEPVRIDHSPSHQEAEECLTMNIMAPQSRNIYLKSAKLPKVELDEFHPDKGPYLYKINGETYTGQYFYGKKDGYGLEVFTNGGYYEGNYVKGKREGYGREVMGSDSIDIQNRDDFKVKPNFHPQQIFLKDNYLPGEYYEGEWSNNQRFGEGKEVRDNGYLIYDGNWRNDMKNGRGKEIVKESGGHYKISKTVKTTKGSVLNSALGQDPENNASNTDKKISNVEEEIEEEVAIGALYDGNWRDNKKHGKGLWKWSDGSYYKGEFENDNISGYGEYLYPDGKKYTGNFLNNKKHGQGKYWIYDTTNPQKQGLICEGQFQNNSINGSATITWPDGKIYKGMMKNNKRHGEGVEISSEGVSKKGIWESGNLIKILKK